MSVDSFIGKEQTDALLTAVGMTRDYFKNKSNWMSMAAVDRFVDLLKKNHAYDQTAFNQRAVEIMLTPERSGINYYLLTYFATPEKAFSSMQEVCKRFNKVHNYSVKFKGLQHASFALSTVPGKKMSKHLGPCENWKLALVEYIRIMTGKAGIVEGFSAGTGVTASVSMILSGRVRPV